MRLSALRLPSRGGFLKWLGIARARVRRENERTCPPPRQWGRGRPNQSFVAVAGGSNNVKVDASSSTLETRRGRGPCHHPTLAARASDGPPLRYRGAAKFLP